MKRLKRRLAEIGRGHLVGPRAERLTFEDLARDYLRDDEVRGLRSADTARLRVSHLRHFFGLDRALDITTDRIRMYQAQRLHDGAEAATINRETAALARMFALAVKAGHLPGRPAFPSRLEKRSPRQGFFEHAEYLAIRQHLPSDYRDVLDFGYHSGWRRKEITQLTWPEVDLSGGVIRLDPDRSKTKIGRLLPLSPPLRDVVSRRVAVRRLDTPLVFHHNGGGAHRRLAQDVGTGVSCGGTPGETLPRSPPNSGTQPRSFGGARAGGHGHHRSQDAEHIFDRYNVVREDDLKQATARLADYVVGQPTIPTVVGLPAAPKRAQG